MQQAPPGRSTTKRQNNKVVDLSPPPKGHVGPEIRMQVNVPVTTFQVPSKQEVTRSKCNVISSLVDVSILESRESAQGAYSTWTSLGSVYRYYPSWGLPPRDFNDSRFTPARILDTNNTPLQKLPNRAVNEFELLYRLVTRLMILFSNSRTF